MPSPDRSTHPSPLIGRALQIEVLQAALADVQDGTGRCVIVSGEAGVGKSRLLREFRAEFDAETASSDAPVLQGNCVEADRALAYAPIADALRRTFSARPAAEVAEMLGPLAPELVKLLPELALTVPDLAPTPALAPAAEKRRLFEAVIRLFARLATPGPLLVIIEDVHWSDETSLELLHALARRLPSLPVLLLLTTRPGTDAAAVAHFLAQMNRERLAQEIRLHPLSLDATDAFLRALFAWDRPVQRPLLHAIYTLTEGNPFFVEEVAGALVDSGDIYQAGGRWQTRSLTDLPIPHSLHLLVQQRTASLSPAAAELLALAAVGRRNVDFDLLARLTGYDEATLLALVKELIEARLLEEAAPDTFTFRHALTRQAIYSGLLSREKRRWHRAIATFYEQQAESGPTRLPALSYHFYAAGMWEQALRYAQLAGAQARYAPHAALEHFARAATAAAELGQALPLDVQRRRGRARQMIGDFEAARADFEAVLDAARAIDDRQAEWQALHDLGFLWQTRNYARTGDYLREALALARRLEDPAGLAQSLNRLGNWQANVGQVSDALALHREALALFEDQEDEQGIAATLDLIATAHGIAGNIVASNAHYRRAIPLFERLGDRQGLASSLLMLAPDDEAAGTRALRLTREIGWRDGEAYAHVRLALGYTFRGDFGAALEHGQQGLAIAREIDHVPWQTAALHGLGTTYLFMLSLDEADRYLQQALQMAQTGGVHVWIQTALAMLVLARIYDDDPAGAGNLLTSETPPATRETLGGRFLSLAEGELALAQKEPEAALAAVETVLSAAPDLRAWKDRALPFLRHLQGRALLAAGREEDALVALSDAVTLSDDYGMRPLRWRCHADLARVHLARKERDEAEAELAPAGELIATLAATIPGEGLRHGFEEAAQDYLPTLPSLTRLQKKKRAFGGLTRRERQVAALVAQGMTNAEIADELYITVRTTKTHVSNILGKLDFSSRTQIAAWAVEKGLLD